ASRSEPLSGEDLGFWWGDQPRQRTTMAMLLLLDRRPHSDRLRAAVWRAVEAVPRLRQRVVDAPLDLARPRWEDDPTFDLDFHVRRYAVSHDDGAPEHATLADLFHTLGPIYERPFDRTRPLWELIELDGPGPGSALFFRLHHGVADGVGGNAILAALTDAEADAPAPPLPKDEPPGAWDEEALGTRLVRALGQRIEEDRERGRALGRLWWTAFTSPSSWLTAGRAVRGILTDLTERTDSPLQAFGPSRQLSGFALPFEPLRKARATLGGQMIDVMLTAVAGAVGAWHRAHDHADVSDVMTLVPINLRPREQQGLGAATGNRATGVVMPLPLRERDPVARFREIHERVVDRKTRPLVEHLPAMAEVLAVLPRPVFRTLSRLSSGGVNLIVTNVPGIMQPRFVAGARVTAGYPFAPLGPRCPVSIALYGYDQQLYVGIDADRTAMPDLGEFEAMLRAGFAGVIEAAEARA
ncbi:MAG: wax ester/triacylglycerol synthase domain-containing protein, partial [Myxococcota bacterium]